MGLMRFLLPDQHRVSDAAIERAFMAGAEGIPWQGRVARDNDGLVVDRSVSESGNLYITWHVEGHGELLLSTACLMERPSAYHLPVELARGTLNRLRNQIAAWQSAGLTVSAEVVRIVQMAKSSLAVAVTGNTPADVATAEAEQSICHSQDAMTTLAAEYTAQALAIRHQQAPKLQTVFGATLDQKLMGENAARPMLAAFNAAAVPMTWRNVELNAGQQDWGVYEKQVEWCRKRALRVLGGPLLRMDQRSLPDWLFLWEDDYENIESYVTGFIESTVKHFLGKVTIWNCASRLNVGDAISLNEEQRLHLAVRSIEAVRRVDSRTPLIVTFDQPWAEYVAHESYDLAPLQYADALARANLGLTGFGLEINLGYWPDGTLPRDLLDLSYQLDRWSLLGLPLVIFLTIPSSSNADAQAAEQIKPLDGLAGSGLSEESQQDIANSVIRLMLSKQCVQGIFWNQLYDSEPHDFPHGGLFNSQGDPKPVFDTLASIRQEHMV